MGKTSFNRLNHKIKSWRIGDYFRQFSIVAAGIIVTFWGNDRITENARQKEVRATMQLITEELEYNKQELRNIKHLLDIDIHMSLLLKDMIWMYPGYRQILCGSMASFSIIWMNSLIGQMRWMC